MPAVPVSATDDKPSFSFNGSPLDLPAFMEFLRNHLPGVDSKHRSLLRDLTVSTAGNRPRVACMSSVHAIAVRDRLIAFSFDSLPPMPFSALESKCRERMREVNVQALIDSGKQPGSFDYPYPSANSATVMASSEVDFASLPFSVEDREEYFISLRLIEDSLYSLANTIVGLYSIDSMGRADSEKHANNGIMLLQDLQLRRDHIKSRAGAALTRQWNAHVSRGLTSSDHAGWMIYYEKAVELQRAMPADRKQHDSVLAPNQCGGPVIDIYGNAIGINIARAGRVSSYAIPAKIAAPAIADMLNSAIAKPTSNGSNVVQASRPTPPTNSFGLPASVPGGISIETLKPEVVAPKAVIRP
jgi:hypothetical protein